jgi:GNAT superfamily N-acetyltransferase
MIKLDVQLEDYHQSEHGGYVLRMLGELYDSQVQFFRQGSGVVMTDPVAAIDSHVIDIIKYQGKRCGIIMSCGSGCFENTVSISDIILEEGYRRKGIARKALSIVISRALADGAKHIGLNVHTDNIPAVRLYESLGFKPQSQWMVMGLQDFTPNDGKPKTPKPEEHVTQEELEKAMAGAEPDAFRRGMERFEKRWISEAGKLVCPLCGQSTGVTKAADKLAIYCPNCGEIDMSGGDPVRVGGLEEACMNLQNKLAAEQKPMDPEAEQILNDNWKDLVGPTDKYPPPHEEGE